MTKYILHIGPTKTGSKYLQSILFHSRANLLMQGICYPDNWWTAPDQIMHDGLLHLLRERSVGRIKESFRQINEAGHKIVVLSCEGFDALEPDQLEILRDAIGRQPIEIVYYCRRWSDRIPSDWKQEIKMGGSSTLPEYYSAYMRDPGGVDAVSYARVWDKFSKIFGRRKLRLVSFSNLQDKGIDPYSHFTDTFLGISHHPYLEAGLIQTNVSPDIYDTEIMRVLNWLDFQSTGRVRLNIRIKFELLRHEWDTRALTDVMAGDLGTLEIRDDSAMFQHSWGAMCKYSDRLISKNLGKELFARRVRKLAYVRSDYLLRGDVLEKIKNLYQKITQAALSHPGLS